MPTKKELQERIAKIQNEIKKIPYHKGTEHHIGLLKARLAKLKEELKEIEWKKTGKGGGKGFALKKHGDATVVLVGFPSVGKSSLLNRITGVSSKVAEYPFTTVSVVPGVLHYKGACIQIFDLPGIIKGASRGKGRGREVLSVARVADLIVLVVDSSEPESLKDLWKELYETGLRLGEKPPRIKIEKRQRGGIEIVGKTTLSSALLKDILRSFGYHNAKVTILEPDISTDRFIDAIFSNRVYLPYLLVFSKADLLSEEQKEKLKKEFPKALFVSNKTGKGIKELKEAIFKALGLIRVFLRPDISAPPSTDPLILKKGSTVKDLVFRLFGENVKIKGAKVEGKSVRFKNQLVSLSHILEDKDTVFLLKE